MTLSKVQVVWTGFSGAPGYTTLYFDAAVPPPTTAVRNWFDALKTSFPSIVTIQVPAAGDQINEVTGFITGSWTNTVQAPVVGAGGTAYSAPVGYIANLNTATIVNGRRLRGRSFLVPASVLAYDAQGNITTALLATITTANNAFIAAVTPYLVVWHRPVDHAGGSAGNVTTITTPDKACVLRSRRD